MIGKHGEHISHRGMPPWRLSLAAIFVTVCGVLSACSSNQAVPRKNGGTLEHGRHIPPQAYAWYARGLHFERQGRLKEAESAYQAALDHDQESGSAWGALVRVRCEGNDKSALEAAARGLKQAQRLAPILTARAACLLRTWATHQDQQEAGTFLQHALSDSQRAAALEPAYAPATQLTVRCLRLLARPQEAARWERGFRLYATDSLPSEAPPEHIDDALLADDLTRARQLAVSRMSAGQLAVRALAWGKGDLARAQAAMTLKASPHDPDALLVQYLQDHKPLSIEPNDALSDLGLLLLTRALQRNVSEEAALHFWKASWVGMAPPQDPLLRQLAKEARLPLP